MNTPELYTALVRARQDIDHAIGSALADSVALRRALLAHEPTPELGAALATVNFIDEQLSELAHQPGE